jgi:hypothetical protein
MYPELDGVLRRYLSGAAAQRHTEEITRYYRSPGSSGYHAATRYVADAIRAAADEVIEDRYPLDGETKFMGRTMPPAWEPIGARLEVISPARRVLMTYEFAPSTLPWWCGSTPPGGAEVQVIDVGRGLAPADYAGKPVRGNAVLIRDSESRPAWHHAAELARAQGAAGIITDFLHSQTPPFRTRQSVPHAVQLLRMTARWENPWAFSVGYDAAEHLGGLLRAGPVRVKAAVEAKTFKGEGVNLIATIRGADRADESVFFIAHTSAGTKPCANCAAGPALMIELCKAIRAAIDAGDLARPRRSIRFMFVAEGLGSSYFLHKHRNALSSIKATLCLDSVGHNQSRLSSSLVMYRSPDSAPTYLNDLGHALIDEASKEAAWPFRNGPVISLVNFQPLPYTPWSDNHYWVTFGVPAPLFMSWPDRYFHTQLLTADHTDPMVFERCGRVTGSLALGIARAGAAEVGPLMHEVAGRAIRRVGHAVRVAMQDGGARRGAADRVRYIVDRDSAAIRSALDLAAGDAGVDALRGQADALVADLEERARIELGRLGEAAAPGSRADGNGAERAQISVVPARAVDGVAPGVVGLSFDQTAALVEAMQAEDAHVNWETLRIFGDELWNLANGHRTIAEIAKATCLEFGFDVSARHFETIARGLERAGYFALTGS